MNLKKLLPLERYTLTTKLSMAEINARLTANVLEKNSSKSSTVIKEFQGKVSPLHFKIQRIITYRNSFLPVILGNITSTVDQSEIKITMRPAAAVIIFMCFWLGIVGIVCTFILAQAIFRLKEIFQHGFSPMILMPFAMFIFGSLLFVLPFKMEAKQAKAFLNNLFQAETNND